MLSRVPYTYLSRVDLFSQVDYRRTPFIVFMNTSKIRFFIIGISKNCFFHFSNIKKDSFNFESAQGNRPNFIFIGSLMINFIIDKIFGG